jgi:beta-lactamase regulating signal transducer with metallopeptidase domain
MLNHFLSSFPQILIFATLLMTGMAVVVWIVLRVTKIQSPRLHRIGWGFVLVQGVLFFHIPVSVPWYDSPIIPEITQKKPVASPAVSNHQENKSKITPKPIRKNKPYRKRSYSKISKKQNKSDFKLFKINTFSLKNEESQLNKTTSTISVKTAKAIKKSGAKKPVAIVIKEKTEQEAKASFFEYLWIQFQKINPVSFLYNLWAIGLIILFSAGCFFYLFLLYLLRKATPASNLLQREFNSLQDERGTRKPLPLYLHDSLGPMLCLTPSGFRIVVPEKLWGELPFGERRAILRHELAHYERGDVWKSLVARILVLPHWFNPVSWYAAKRFDESAEWACDLKLSRKSPEDVPLLARALLKVAEPVRAQSVFVSTAAGAPLCTRLKRLLKNYSQEDSLMKRYFVFVSLVAIAAAGMFRIHLVAKEDAVKTIPKPTTIAANNKVKSVASSILISKAVAKKDLNIVFPSQKNGKSKLTLENLHAPARTSTPIKEEDSDDLFQEDPPNELVLSEVITLDFSSPDEGDEKPKTRILVPSVSGRVSPKIKAPGFGDEEEDVPFKPESGNRDLEVLPEKVDPKLVPLIEELVKRAVEKKDDNDGFKNETIVDHFKKILKTEQGKLLLQDRAFAKLEELKERALPEIWGKYQQYRHDNPDGNLNEIDQELIARYKVYQDDIQLVEKEIQKIQSGLQLKTETGKLLHKFLSYDHAPSVLYASLVRGQVEYDQFQLLKFLHLIWKKNKDGKYEVLEERRIDDDLDKPDQELLYQKMFDNITSASLLLKEELSDWSNDLAGIDDLHEKLKLAMTEPLFASFCIRYISHEDSANKTGNYIIDQYFKSLEEQTEDTAQGLVIRKEFRTHISNELIAYEKAKRVYGPIRKFLNEFKKQIDPSIQKNKVYYNWLDLDHLVFMIADNHEYRGDTPDVIVRDFFNEFFQVSKVYLKSLNDDSDDLFGETNPEDSNTKPSTKAPGKSDNPNQKKLIIQSEQEEELNHRLQGWFQYYREIRRKNRLTRKLAENVKNEELKLALESLAGTMILFEELEKQIPLNSGDGLISWIDEYFVKDKDQWILRDNHRDVIQELLDEFKESYPEKSGQFDNPDDEYENSIDRKFGDDNFEESNSDNTFNFDNGDQKDVSEKKQPDQDDFFSGSDSTS